MTGIAPPLQPLLPLPLPLPSTPGSRRDWAGLAACGHALGLAALRPASPDFWLVIAPGVARAEALEAELRYFSDGTHRIALFPDTEVLPYDTFSPHQDLTSRRLTVLRDVALGHIDTLLVAASTLLPRLPPLRYIGGYSVQLAAGQNLRPEQLRLQLETAGYQRVSQVLEHGDFAVRGSLLDFYPMGSTLPVRVDFLDDEIDSLRQFDPESQLSGDVLESLETLPAREMPVDAEAIKQFRQAYRRRFEGNPARSIIYREVSEGRMPGGIENYLPLFFDSTALLWDYLPNARITISLGEPEHLLAPAWQQINERFADNREDSERPALEPHELNGTPEDHLARVQKAPLLVLDPGTPDPTVSEQRAATAGLASLPSLLIDARAEEPTHRLREFIHSFPGRLLFSAESAGRREMLTDLLRQEAIPGVEATSWGEFIRSPRRAMVGISPLSQGLLLREAGIAIVTERELYGERPRGRRRQRRVRDPEQILSDLTDLHPGAPIVHVDHGVGRYRGLTTMTIDELPLEFLTLEYAGGDLLHVPVASLHMVSRYTGTSAEDAPLHKLGSDQWDKARRKAAARIRDVAAELLELYAKRAARQATRPAETQHDYAAFAAGFPFEPTEDQASAIDAVVNDLNSGQPMDRLVCGDVGFGKTEVALRAAFIAVSQGRQVAVLVPTTLLAQQHYQTFADRFADWPVSVEVLSRFRSAEESRKVLDGIAAGSVDIVIGTHRLLQGDMHFKNLGLIIVDEEHRFGVRHKERLKTLRTEADVLTLTATPIPRTLNMALGRLRDLSLIATPPEARLSIKTFVTRFEGRVIREACLRELKRGGQVYFVHNHIEDIEKIAAELAALIPEARIEIAHGQMRERDLEQVMLDFHHRRFHILLCTAIIESGLDIPSANTIIINRADRFGLAQLHQLRGRVGRSHHQAFAYLLAPPREALTADAEKRLDAIAALEDLGSGFMLATHDMEIRGAGELLGEGQSGQIQEIGFELYNDMLTRTVKALQDGLEPDLDTAMAPKVEINLHLPALLPDDYMPNVHLRLVHYKRIASARSDEALRELQVELVDRFGPLPEATRYLFRMTALRLRAEPLSIRRLDASPVGGFVEFGPRTTVSPAWIVTQLQNSPETYRLDRQQKFRFSEPLDEPETRFTFVEKLIGQMLANQEKPAAAAPSARAPAAGWRGT
ncbi:MAG: transcription-repair coupling factor [Gammaproteobacteria bacterium]|nr:transcription-repair coupling factor [Gammaproteobacteria bacterium]